VAISSPAVGAPPADQQDRTRPDNLLRAANSELVRRG
jgi:hypothetical protein